MKEDLRIGSYIDNLSKNAIEKGFMIKRPDDIYEENQFVLIGKFIKREGKKPYIEECARLRLGINHTRNDLPVFLNDLKYEHSDSTYNDDVRDIITKTNEEHKGMAFSYSAQESEIISLFLSDLTGPLVEGEPETLHQSAREWGKNVNGRDDPLILRNKFREMNIKFSSGGPDSNGESVVDYFDCKIYDQGHLKDCNNIHYNLLRRSILYSSDMDAQEDLNLNIIEEMDDGHELMLYKNLPKEIYKYVPVSKYEAMIDFVKERSNVENKHELYYKQNLNVLRKRIIELYKTNNNIRYIIDESIKISNINEDHKSFIKTLEFSDIKSLFNNNKYIKVDDFNMNISSENVLKEMTSILNRAGSFPLKHKTGEINIDILMPKYQRDILDKLFQKENKKLDFIKNIYENIPDSFKKRKSSIDILKYHSAKCVASITNHIFETCPNLYGGVMVSDIISSVIWDKLNLKEPNGNEIRINTIDLDEYDKSDILDIENSKERIESYVELMLGKMDKSDSDDGFGEYNLLKLNQNRDKEGYDGPS